MIGQDHPDDVVISGIAGVFPKSKNVEEFKKNLLSGEDMISLSRKPNDSSEEVKAGYIENIDRFDNSFFRINQNRVPYLTFAAKMYLEKSFEAILDAGYNPQEIKGKNIAVIGGIWEFTKDGDPAMERDPADYNEKIDNMEFMIANRVSNWLDIHGPGYSINTACSSSLYAIDNAIKTIQRGQCEGAIVCTANLCLRKVEQFAPLFSHKGNSAPFDADAGGYVRAEVAAAVFLQKRKYARRAYATIIHSTTNSDGFKEEGFAFPSVKQQINLYEQFYKEINMDPRQISYIEAHGTGTKVGDVVEGTSIDEFFCVDRETPLKVGALKSNMGHGEAAAALSGIIKMIIAFETGTIPANLRFNKPNPSIKGLFNGHLEIISKPTPLEGEYFALNSFGIGGSNGHIVMSPHKKIKSGVYPLDGRLPWLVTVSGRTEEAVDYILNEVEKNSNDAEYIRLWHEIFKYNISGHTNRGYVIIQNNKKQATSNKFFSGEKRPLWFVFSGMGSQWPAMGKSLMEIPIFAESIKKSHEVLLLKGLDLIKMITDDDPHIFDSILNIFVGLAAIQIALVDLLTTLNIKPDGIIGHSVGELGCAYADGCLTAEQMLLTAYYRGLVSLETKVICGTMAAVGENYNVIKDIIPPEIDIACHNGPTSCTLSGPTEIVQDFMRKLEKKQIFVRAVNTANIAFHSRYIASMGPKLVSYLKKIIPQPKPRSEKWICTSAPENKWESDDVKYCSAEYYTNNVLSPVYFEEGCHYIPDNAITVEIAPHGLLNAILKRSLPTTVDNIPISLRDHQNNVEYLLNALGKIFEAGCEMELSHLYPPIEFPVSRSTPMISPAIKWKYEEQDQLDKMRVDTSTFQSKERTYTINPKLEIYNYVYDHIIDGRNLFPGFGYLWLVVETISSIEKKTLTRVPVVFENVQFEHAITVSKKGILEFRVSIQELNNHFEMKCNGVIVVTGKVRVPSGVQKEMINVVPFGDNISNSDILPLSNNDFYKELRLRGYHYKGLFRNVQYTNIDGTYAEVPWCNNFVTFMDSMAQTTLLHTDCRSTIVPTYIRKVVIDFEKHFETLESLDKENPKFPINFYPHFDLISSGGIQMMGCKGNEISRQKNQADPIIEKYQFVPFIRNEKMDSTLVIKICVQIAMENTLVRKAITYELLDQEYDPEIALMSSVVTDALSSIPSIEMQINVLTNSEKFEKIEDSKGITISNEKLPSNKTATLIILSNIQNKTELIEPILDTLQDGGFIITKQSVTENTSIENLGFNVCFSRMISDREKIVLLNKVIESKPVKQAIQIKNTSYSWISEAQNALSQLEPEKDEKLVVYAEKEPTNGILGFFSSMRKEENGKSFRCFFILDNDAPSFSLDNPFYKSWYHKNLCQNVYKNGEWGTYQYLILDSDNTVESVHAFCTVEECGNLSSLKWVEGSLNPAKYKDSNGRSLIYLYYSALNFKDIMLAVGRISITDSSSFCRLFDCHQGLEFSGRDVNGVRLMGMVHGKGIATMIESIPHLTWKVPDSMTLEEAATIPVVYTTVIFAFLYKMALEEGYSVLIHAGSGGIGQAAINICLHYKCNIFTTVGTPEKVEFIKKTFPQIPESHIGNSRDTSFEQMIMNETEGRGVDVVLNSLAGDKLRASVRCVAKGGHFLEIGKFDMAKNNSLELGHFLNDISFHSVQLDVLLLNAKNKKIVEISNRLQKMLCQGIIKPIRRTIFQIDEVESAFRYMASGKHIGKVVIKIRDEEEDLKTKPNVMHLKVKSRVLCQEDKSYVILGGLGGFGMELADWLVIRGARNIVLSSRTGIKNGYQSYRINLWRSYGANVVISTADISEELGVKSILEMANSLGPVAGIFNLAVVLKDDQFSKQAEDKYRIVVDPKATATIHLDQLSRKMCPCLEYFVVFSSAVSSLGNAEQTNYGFANSIADRICEARHVDNLPALAIHWGAIGEVGIVSEFFENNLSLVIGGMTQQEVRSCLDVLNDFMKQRNPIVGSRIIAQKRKVDSDIIMTIANALGIKDLKTISLMWTLPELGMDSILAIEVKQILEAEFDMFFTPEDLRTMTFAKLYRLKKSKGNASKSDHEASTKQQLFMNEEVWNAPLIRIPFIDGEISAQLPIDENPTVFIFPGIEGLAFSVEALAKNLPFQVLCFQYHFLTSVNHVQALCDYFSSYILEKLPPEQEFHFIGYSLGVAITLQVAEVLEKQGRKGHIWLIDSSPTTVKMLNQKTFEEKLSIDDESLQNQICIAIMQTFLPGFSKEEFSKYIEKATEWESKKKMCFSMLSQITKNENIIHRLFDRVYSLLKSLPEYKMSDCLLNSPCVFIRCIQNLFNLPLDEFYGLTEHFKNPIEIHKIENVDHYSILSHPKTAEIIMKSSVWKKE